MLTTLRKFQRQNKILLFSHLETIGEAGLETGTIVGSGAKFGAEGEDRAGGDISEKQGETDSETGEEAGANLSRKNF